MSDVKNETPPQQQRRNGNGNAPKLWRVVVRHSPFPLKSAAVEADSQEQAIEKFLAMAKEVNEKKGADMLAHQEGADINRAIKARREAFQRGLEAHKRGELDWSVKPESEFVAAKEAIKERQSRTWGTPERMSV